MWKRMLLLALALSLGLSCACAEDIYYANDQDIYYHTDPDCDRPKEVGRYGIEGMDFYARECFEKRELSAEAASASEKKACPVCVQEFEPVYLGEHMPAWEYDFAPWGMGDRGDAPLGSKEYRAEVEDTFERFQAYFEEVYDRKTGATTRRHP